MAMDGAPRSNQGEVWRDVDLQIGNYVRGKFFEIGIVGHDGVERTIEVTARLRSIVTGATLAIFAFYLISFGLSFFQASVVYMATVLWRPPITS